MTTHSIYSVPRKTTVLILLVSLAVSSGAMEYLSEIPESEIQSITIAQALGGTFNNTLEGAPQTQVASALSQMSATVQAAELSTGMKELAHALGSVASIYEWVSDNIDYVPYYGLKKGAEATFLTRSGNDADQADLMIALLREQGVVANYYVGLINISFDSAFNWIGAADIGAAVTAFVNGGYTQGYTIGYNLTSEVFTLEHIFVWAYDDNDVLQTYFPAIKGCAHTQPPSLESLTGYSRQDLLNAAGGTNTVDSASGQSYDDLGDYLTGLGSNLTTSLKTSHPNAGREILLGTREIDPEYAIAFGVSSYITNHYSLPYKHVQYLDVWAGNSAYTYVALPAVGARKLYFTYTNSIFSLYLDDVVQYSAVDPTATDMRLALDYPTYGGNRNFDTQYTYGISSNGVYVITLGDESADQGTGLEFRRARMAQTVNDSSATETEKIAEALAVTGEIFMRENAAYQRLLGGMEGYRFATKKRIGIVGQGSGYYVDIKNNTLIKYDAYASASTNASFFPTELVMLSGFEHSVLEQGQGADSPAVSTVKILKLANDSTDPVYRLDTNNFAHASTNLVGYDQFTMDTFSNHVQNGSIIIVPENADVSLIDWEGHGYFQYFRNASGDQQMSAIIAGGYKGGFSGEEGEIDYYKLYTKEAANARNPSENPHPEFGEPVDMVTGAYLLDHDDLVMEGPIPLRLSRHYSSQSRNNKGDMGYGWLHSYNISAKRHSAYDAGLGLRAPEDAVSVFVATTAIKDLTQNEDTAQGWLAASLTANWAMEQLIDNAVSINDGQRVTTFIEQPDGSFTPPPGMKVSLIETNGAYAMQERHGNSYEFSTNALIETITDPDGNTLSFTYNTDTNLYQIISSFGPQFTFSYVNDLLDTVSDNSGRSVSYQYDADNNLTNFVDAGGFDWGITYDGDHKIKSLHDPEGITTIQNFYNDAAQVTNQISPTGKPWNYYFTGSRNIGEDPLGNQTIYYVDKQKRTWSVEKADGSRMYTYQDGQNHVTSMIDEAGTTNIYVYDVNHNLLSQTNAVGTSVEVAVHHGYDAEHYLRFITNAVGTAEEVITEYTYTPEHHIDTVTGAKGSGVEVLSDLNYFGNGLLQQRSDGSGKRVTTYTYDGNGNPGTVASTDAGTVELDYNLRGEMIARRDAKGAETEYSYDNLAKLLVTELDDGTTVSNSYWDNGLLKTSTDARGKTTHHYWTDAYKPAGIVFPDTAALTNLYDSADRLVATKDANNNWVTNALDSVDRVLSVSSANSSVTNQYDAVGNITNSVVDPDGLYLQSRFAYDALNRMTHNHRPIGHEEYQMDSLGRVTNRVDAAFKDWQTEYDELGRMKKPHRPSGNYEEYGYDALGNRTAFWNAEFKPMTFGVDAQGRVTSITNAINKVTSFVFDDAGNLSQRTAADLKVTDYGYDALNRLVAITNEGVEVATFDHDNNGNVTSMENDGVSVSLGYDSMSRISASTQTVGSATSIVGYQHDLNGNRTHVTYPGNTNAVYVYGTDNRLESVDLSAFGIPSAISFQYDSASRMTNILYPNGVNSTFGLDAEGRITSIEHGTFIDRTIQRNALGFKEVELIDAGLNPMALDTKRIIKTHNDADQLISEQVQTSVTNWFEISYSYSANGCLTNQQSAIENRQFAYDFDNRITSASSVDSAVEYLYDASGVRVGRVDGSTTNYFVVDYADSLKRPLAEMDSAGSVTRYYVWSGVRLLCHIEANGDVYYYHSDELGSTLALTDDTGTVMDEFAYMPYGYANHSGTTDTPFQWLGGYGVYYDVDTELHLTLHRAYSCSLKRFIHPDPLGIDGGVNVYMWASLNPVWFVDPTGLRVEIQWHEVFESGNYHSSLIITPENQSQYQNDSRFIQNDAGEFFVTVGAESQFNTLVADLNRGSDIAPHDPGFTLIIPGGFESEDAFINSILQAHENYSDNLPYDAFPSPPEDRVWYLADDDYNSNSYIAGLLQNLGFEPIPLGVNLPGWDVPVPSVNYK